MAGKYQTNNRVENDVNQDSAKEMNDDVGRMKEPELSRKFRVRKRLEMCKYFLQQMEKYLYSIVKLTAFYI